MTVPQIYTVVALCIYTALMIFIGCISYGKSKNLDSFLIGEETSVHGPLRSLMEPPISLLLCSLVTQASTAGTSASVPSGSAWATQSWVACCPGCCLPTAPER